MGALAVADVHRGWEDAGRGGRGARGPDDVAAPAQPRLFALAGGIVEAPVAPAAVPAPAAPVRTLDEVVLGAWAGVSAGRPAACPVCGGALRPRWSAGAGVVGGRCDGCGSALD